MKTIHSLWYSTFADIVSVPYPNQTLKTNYSKTPRQKFIVNIYSHRVSLALSEYNFTFNFCRVVSEKLVLKKWYREKFGEIALLIIQFESIYKNQQLCLTYINLYYRNRQVSIIQVDINETCYN